MARTKQSANKASSFSATKRRARKEKAKRVSAPGGPESKKPRRFRPGTVALREIRKYQKTHDLVTKRAPFVRLVRAIASRISPQEHRFESVAFDVLREATEALAVNLFGDVQLAAIHAKRQTIMPKDLHHVLAIREESDLLRPPLVVGGAPGRKTSPGKKKTQKKKKKKQKQKQKEPEESPASAEASAEPPAAAAADVSPPDGENDVDFEVEEVPDTSEAAKPMEEGDDQEEEEGEEEGEEESPGLQAEEEGEEEAPEAAGGVSAASQSMDTAPAPSSAPEEEAPSAAPSPSSSGEAEF